MSRITRVSLIAATLLAAIAVQPGASLAEETAQPAPAAAKKTGCQMAGCTGCAANDCPAMAAESGGTAAADCPCKHAKKGSKKAKRKAATKKQQQQ